MIVEESVENTFRSRPSAISLEEINSAIERLTTDKTGKLHHDVQKLADQLLIYLDRAIALEQWCLVSTYYGAIEALGEVALEP